MHYEVCNADYDSGMIDWHGQELLPMEYDNITMMGDGQHLLLEDEGVYIVCKIG